MRKSLLPLTALILCALLPFASYCDLISDATVIDGCNGTVEQTDVDANYEGTGGTTQDGRNVHAEATKLTTSSDAADPSERSAAGGAGQGQSGETDTNVSKGTITGPVSEKTHY